MSAIDRNIFLSFCSKLVINSKDKGLIPLIPSTTQLYLLGAILAGLSQGKHQFCVLKCRQAQASTLCLAFSLYWSFKYAGTNGMLVTEKNDNRLVFRATVGDFIRGLPEGPEWRQPVATDNRDFIAFGNRSRLIFANANARDRGGLGRGLGLNLVHGTEVSRWKDKESYQSLMSSVSLSNPNRFFIFESTANGNANLFKEMWTKAGSAVSQVPIFIPWMVHDEYQCAEESNEYQTYWDGRLTDEEETWVSVAEGFYGIKVTPERIAWWRSMYYEKFFEDISTLYQEYPPLPRLAFQFGGSPHISTLALQARYEEAEKATSTNARFYRVWFGQKFEDTLIEQVDETRAYDLVVWEGARDNQNYIIGVDPSHGINSQSDQCAFQVLCAYADGVEQVAEFAARGLPAYKAAWILLFLAGCYKQVMINIEIYGGGTAIMNEIDRVTNEWGSSYPAGFSKYFEELQHYHYRRTDSLTAGYSARNTATNERIRQTMLENIRNGFEQGWCHVKSTRLVDEASCFHWTEEGDLQVAPGESDDLVLALGLAVMAYEENILPSLEGTKDTYTAMQQAREIESRGLNTTDLLKYRLTDFMESRQKL